MNIFLIGYRCSGKTSVGSSLSDIIRWPFIDTDFQLTKELGMNISEIVDKKGWDFFRAKESSILKKVCNYDKQIVATGGGIVLKKENIVNMKKNGTIVWLKANFATVKKRIILDTKTKDFRPSLTSKELDDEIKETLLLRKPYYGKAMDFFIDTDNLNIDGVCKAVIKRIV
jgi:shikimate kinase